MVAEKIKAAFAVGQPFAEMPVCPSKELATLLKKHIREHRPITLYQRLDVQRPKGAFLRIGTSCFQRVQKQNQRR